MYQFGGVISLLLSQADMVQKPAVEHDFLSAHFTKARSFTQICERRRDGEPADDGGVHRGAARAQTEFQRPRSGDEGGALGR